jgi:26S proteasome regulatory subunit T5
MSSEEIKQRIRLLDNEIRIMKSDITSIDSESESQRKRIKENMDKIKLNKQLPYLVGHVVEVLEMEDEEEEEDGGAADIDSQRKVRSSYPPDGGESPCLTPARCWQGKSAVIKTSTRQTIYLPIPGLVDVNELKPQDLVGTNKDSYLILEKLPAEYDSRVKAMEVRRERFVMCHLAACVRQEHLSYITLRRACVR